MDTNKMREQFEAAYVKACVERGAGHQIAEAHLSRAENGEYASVWMRGAWWAWQASRAAVVVELPKPHYEFEGDEAPEMFASQVVAAIEAQGLKVEVKP